MTKSTPNQRLRRAREAARKELPGLPANDSRVLLWSSLKVALDNIHAVLGAGGQVDVGSLLKIHESMASIRASMPPEQIKVEIAFVDGATGNRSTDIKELYPPESKSAPKQIEAEAVEVADKSDIKPEAKAEAPAPAPAPAPPSSAPPRNPSMEIWNRLSGYDPHAAPDGGPGRIGGRGRDPSLAQSRDVHPYIDPVTGKDRVLAHPLPTPKVNGQ